LILLLHFFTVVLFSKTKATIYDKVEAGLAPNIFLWAEGIVGLLSAIRLAVLSIWTGYPCVAANGHGIQQTSSGGVI
jgi:hypothetical protein